MKTFILLFIYHYIVIKMYLGEMFDEFLQKNKKATIDNSIHNITECFFDGKSYQTPQNWGKIDGKRKIVLSYIVKDGLLVSKFKKNTQGKFKQQNDKYAIKKLDLDFKVMSCLCLKPIRNTSFHEVYEVMQKENLEHFFGFYRQNLENIKNSLANFEPEKDSLFVFAGDIQIVKKRLQLQKTWLKQILKIFVCSLAGHNGIIPKLLSVH